MEPRSERCLSGGRQFYHATVGLSCSSRFPQLMVPNENFPRCTEAGLSWAAVGRNGDVNSGLGRYCLFGVSISS